MLEPEFVERVFPVLVMVLCALGSAVYLFNGKWGSAMYWIAAFLINFSIVFLVPKFG